MFAAEQVEVYYESWNRVQADINCMKRLDRYDYKYLINLCGQDFPLKTNYEIVQDLKALNGSNELESSDAIKADKVDRILDGYDLNEKKPYVGWLGVTHYLYRNEFKDRTKEDMMALMGRTENVFWSGSAYFSLSKNATSFLLRSKHVQRFFRFFKDSYSPDESLWATLNRWDQLPGNSYKENQTMPDIGLTDVRVRYVKWAPNDRVYDLETQSDVPIEHRCYGKYVRNICNFGAVDLYWIYREKQSNKYWFANKFDIDIDPRGMECADIVLRKRALKQAYEDYYTELRERAEFYEQQHPNMKLRVEDLM